MYHEIVSILITLKHKSYKHQQNIRTKDNINTYTRNKSLDNQAYKNNYSNNKKTFKFLQQKTNKEPVWRKGNNEVIKKTTTTNKYIQYNTFFYESSSHERLRNTHIHTNTYYTIRNKDMPLTSRTRVNFYTNNK